MPIDDPDADESPAPEAREPDVGGDADGDDEPNRDDDADVDGLAAYELDRHMFEGPIDHGPSEPLIDVMHEGYSGKPSPPPFDVPEPGKDPAGALAELADTAGDWTDKTDQIEVTLDRLEVDEHGEVHSSGADPETEAYTAEKPEPDDELSRVESDTPGAMDVGLGAALVGLAAWEGAVAAVHRVQDWFGRDR
ncbi:hypothetical protein [Streptomyces albicerus]|uniref:hypothetical protein n=1 Tax=Streptomyces albicerus TaxID=2569859 RepID=UPI00124AE7F1|nr:hypothetical protein [Streptomyces albicerus]